MKSKSLKGISLSMKKISTLLLLTTTAALLLSGCRKGSAEGTEPSEVVTINIDGMFAVSSSSSSSKPAAPPPADNNNPSGGDSLQSPESSQSSEAPEPSVPEDRDDDAYYTYISKGAGVMIMGGENEKENIKIPATIKERTVVAVSGSAKKTLFPKAKVIVLPDTLTDIYNYAFAGCTYLTEINIPGGVEEIGEYAFKDCISLQELELPASVTEIEPNAFSGCKSLSTLTLSEGLKKIGEGAFGGCASLTSITLPDSVSSIAYGAFDTSVEFSLSYKGMTFNPYNINDLYTMLS